MSILDQKQSKTIKYLAIAEATLIIVAILSTILTRNSTNMVIFLPAYIIAAVQLVGVGSITYYILATHSNEKSNTKHYLLFLILAVLFTFLYFNTGFLIFLLARLF